MDIDLLRIPSPYERKRISLRLEVDEKTFPPCHGKEVERWSHLLMRTQKYIVHVSDQGEIKITEV
jgi:hypothetical protein